MLTEWALTHAGLLRVQATVLTTNTRSVRVLERCGFDREGLLRRYRLVRGAPGDFWMYSRLAAGAEPD
jgi:ribosomal-protein-alanine N-acetyltransferase